MVQIDVPIAFGIGSLFADAAHKQLQEGRPEYYYRTFWVNNIYQIFFFSWIPVYFLMNYFGWETTHMWWHADSIGAYPFYMPIFLAVFFAAANGGFLLGYKLIRHGHILANRIIYLAILVYSALWVFLRPQVTFKLGTYAEFKAGLSPWFYEDRTFFIMLVLTLAIWFISMVAFVLMLIREGRHLDPIILRQPAPTAA